MKIHNMLMYITGPVVLALGGCGASVPVKVDPLAFSGVHTDLVKQIWTEL